MLLMQSQKFKQIYLGGMKTYNLLTRLRDKNQNNISTKSVEKSIWTNFNNLKIPNPLSAQSTF